MIVSQVIGTFLSTLSLRRATGASQGADFGDKVFLSTLSLRRATITIITICTAWKFLSTLSLRRATTHYFPALHNILISIHALLAESDTCFQLWSPPLQHFYPRSPCGERLCGCELKVRSCRFLSTLSLRRATKDTTARQQIADISIHALLAESDQNISGYRRGYGNFYPRSPCGERHYFCGPAL